MIKMRVLVCRNISKGNFQTQVQGSHFRVRQVMGYSARAFSSLIQGRKDAQYDPYQGKQQGQASSEQDRLLLEVPNLKSSSERPGTAHEQVAHAQHMLSLAWSIAHIKLPSFFKQMRGAVLARLETYTDEDLNQLVVALGSARVKDDDIYHAISAQIQDRLDAKKHRHNLSLSSVALTFAMNQCFDMQLLDCVAQHALLLDPLEDKSDRDTVLVDLAWAFVCAGAMSRSLPPHILRFFNETTARTTGHSGKARIVPPPEQVHELCVAWRLLFGRTLPPLLNSLLTPEWFQDFKERCEDFERQPVYLRMTSATPRPIMLIAESLARHKRLPQVRENFISPRGIFADLFVGGKTIIMFHTSSQLLTDRNTSTGLRRLRARLLTMEGFRVIELNQIDWDRLSPQDRDKILDQVVVDMKAFMVKTKTNESRGNTSVIG